MLPMLNARQIKLLSETAAGAPEPATAQALRDLAELRHLGLLSFDEGGRYTMTPQGQAHLDQYAPAVN
jgi:predicted DNA-binding transcriptional regulator YafY